MALPLVNAINELTPDVVKALAPKLLEVIAVQCQVGQPQTPVLNTVYNNCTQHIVLNGNGFPTSQWDGPISLRFTYTDPATNLPVNKILNGHVLNVTAKEIRLNISEYLAVINAEVGFFEICDVSGAPLASKTVTCENAITG